MTADLHIQAESFADTLEEAAPLILAHCAEIGLMDRPLDFHPSLDVYADLEATGRTAWFALRDNAEALVGYSLFILQPLLMFRGHSCAANEAVYISPDTRSFPAARLLFRTCEDYLRGMGFHAITYTVWKAREFGPLLERMGYSAEQTVHWKFTKEG